MFGSKRLSALKSDTVLARLRRDTRGNTLAMIAAAILPIAGMIGSGLDMSRAYLAQAKLQNACDAGALAARRFMSSAAFTAGAEAEGERFFNFNFPADTMNVGPITLDIGASEENSSVVEVSASTEVPTTIMALFGQDAIPIAVECDADQDYVNNDIMLVLDVTGSMNCQAGTICEFRATEHTTSRLRRLREGAAGLYRALEGTSGVRTRYGFMPYSHTVNVGRDLNDAWIREPANYRRGTCASYPNESTCASTATTATNPPHDLAWRNTWRSNRNWTTASAMNSGCIEERNTIGQSLIQTGVLQNDIDSVSTTVVARKWAPYDPAFQQGERFLAALAWHIDYPTLDSFCPRPARRLAEYANETAFQTEMNRMTGSQIYPTTSPYTGRAAGGYTYHDIGMIWAMRYLSSTGMFQADNPTTLGTPAIRVDKHIVFLTDGEQTVADTPYTAYGVERWDRRMGGNSTGQLARHSSRFLSACSRARSMGMTVWVIALDVGNTDGISPCATSEDHFYISDGSDLEEIFELIGRGIGRLRLTQ